MNERGEADPREAGARASAFVEDGVALLSAPQRRVVLAAAFLGWMFAGMEISLFVLIARPSVLGMLALDARDSGAESLAAQWFAWYQCAFLLGAAAGGWFFGWLGDRAGRARTLAASVLCYSLVTGVSIFAADPLTLVVLRFVACLGVGGAWPSAVSLAVEALPDMSRPLIAGLMGAAANVGFVLLGLIACVVAITPDDWRWVLLVGAAPAVIGVWILVGVSESPRWLADRQRGRKRAARPGRWAKSCVRPC